MGAISPLDCERRTFLGSFGCMLLRENFWDWSSLRCNLVHSGRWNLANENLRCELCRVTSPRPHCFEFLQNCSNVEVLFENHIFYEKVSSIKMIIIYCCTNRPVLFFSYYYCKRLATNFPLWQQDLSVAFLFICLFSRGTSPESGPATQCNEER